jgi:hypothetical protein
MSNSELEKLLAGIAARYAEIREGSAQQESFLAHVRALGNLEREPRDYPDAVGEFPETLSIAYAVCHPDCGTEQFIVEGSTQECQRCGRLMFRNATKEYIRK